MEVTKLYRLCSADDDSAMPQGKLGIVTNDAYITVDMTVKVKSFMTAYKKFMQAINQAVADKVLPASYNEFAQADSDTESDVRNLFSVQSRDVHFDVDDNTDIEQGFYLKLAVHKQFFDTAPSLPVTVEDTDSLPVVVEDVSNLPAVVTSPVVVKKKLGRPKKENKVSSPLIESWFKHLKKVSKVESEQTMRTYHNAISQLLLFFNSQAKDILKLDDDDISLWLEHLKEEKKAASTVQLYLIAARLFFSFLYSEKLISQNPCLVGNLTIKAGVTPDSREEHKRSDLSLAQVQAMLAAMPTATEMELRNRAVVALMVTSGLRCCEVSEAQCGDMTSSGDYTYLKLRGKGHKEKSARVKVDPHAEKMIRQYWAVRFNGKYPKDQDFMFVSTSRNHEFVSTSRKETKKLADTSDMLSTRTIRTICKKAMDKIGIDDPQHVAHSLRHTAATLALDAGEALPNVQMMMRHKNLETTMIYQHSFDRKKNNAELAIGKKIFGETK